MSNEYNTKAMHRLHILNHLRVKDNEFRALYNEIPLQQLSKSSKGKIYQIAIDIPEELAVAL